MSEAPKIHRFVVKIGSSVLTDSAGHLRVPRLMSVVEQVAAASSDHKRAPIIVSSGAVACGMAKLKISKRPKAIAQLQAAAAIGQGELVRLYTQAFEKHGITTAQILLTQDDLSDKLRFRNAKQTILTLIHRHVVPIINENDTVAVDEITFGDNDRLAALLACAIDAQLLIILTDVEGVLENGKPIERIESTRRADTKLFKHSTKQTTRGGIASKFEAARIVGHNGIPMILASGARKSVITDLLKGEAIGTLFVPPKDKLASRKWWIAFAKRHPKGQVTIDGGAEDALEKNGKSLLASGVREVKGQFEAGELVIINNDSAAEIARGIANFSSTELRRIKGLKSAEAADILGLKSVREVVHRDHMVLAKELHQETA